MQRLQNVSNKNNMFLRPESFRDCGNFYPDNYRDCEKLIFTTASILVGDILPCSIFRNREIQKLQKISA